MKQKSTQKEIFKNIFNVKPYKRKETWFELIKRWICCIRIRKRMKNRHNTIR